MSLLIRGASLLKRTEGELKKLLSEAATAGEYSDVVRIASWARSLREMIDETQSSIAAKRPDGLSRTSGRTTDGASGALLKPRSDGGYPRFFRQGDRLVRVAWSKRDKRQYEHRVPRAAINATCAAIADKGAAGRVFSTEEILPIQEDDGSELPNYHAYVVMALLKQIGLIDQHGRQGYSITRPAEFKGAIEAVWRNLPER